MELNAKARLTAAVNDKGASKFLKTALKDAGFRVEVNTESDDNPVFLLKTKLGEIETAFSVRKGKVSMFVGTSMLDDIDAKDLVSGAYSKTVAEITKQLGTAIAALTKAVVKEGGKFTVTYDT